MMSLEKVKKLKNLMYVCSLPGDYCVVWRGEYRRINFARARFKDGAWKLEYSGTMAKAPKRAALQEPMTAVPGAPLLAGEPGEAPKYNGEWPGLVNVLKHRLNLDLCPPKSSVVAKGKSAERQVAAFYREWCGDKTSVERNLDQHKNGGGDLVGPGLLGWYVEVKRRETCQLSTWMKQCDKGAPACDTPVALWWRANGQPWKIWTRIMGQWADEPIGIETLKLAHVFHGEST